MYVCIYVIHMFYTHYIYRVELGSKRMYILVCTYVCMYVHTYYQLFLVFTLCNMCTSRL